MKLEEFISNTIYEICMGIEDAKERVYQELNNQPISPGRMEGEMTNLSSQIDFDLSVSTSTEESTDKRAGVIQVIDTGIGKTDSLSQEAMNRVKFSIPFFPQAVSKKTSRS